MEDFRSKSCKDGRMQIESYYNGGGGGTWKAAGPPTSMHDLRCYSANHAGLSYSNSNPNRVPYDPNREAKLKKSKSSGSKNWSLSDPELQRKRRVASYRVYAVEGKMKGSVKKSLRWIKSTCTHVVSGWW
ncbi:hypothetical protein MLD38_007889 [Melastoma candidum]|uniref:Uncharacterized protein n=1 Tax=Melastoma candidum TaxID=119954 RepID=A0ACB9S133_9MYRT|nr:hypothetical protein MLD38_007889 [Melastoma candidum]